MRYSYLLCVENYDNPDEYVRDSLLLPSESGRPGKLRDLRRWAALLGIKDVMSMKRNELLLLIADRVGWECISIKLSNIGVLKNHF